MTNLNLDPALNAAGIAETQPPTSILTPEQLAARKHSLFCSCGCNAEDDVLQDSHEALRKQLAEAQDNVQALARALNLLYPWVQDVDAGRLTVALAHPGVRKVKATWLSRSLYPRGENG